MVNLMTDVGVSRNLSTVFATVAAKVLIRTAKVVRWPAGQARLPLDKLRCDGELQQLSAARLPSSRGCDGVATG